MLLFVGELQLIYCGDKCADYIAVGSGSELEVSQTIKEEEFQFRGLN